VTDWPAVHEQVRTAFEKGWDAPAPYAWSFSGPDTAFVQPMLRDGVGEDAWAEEVTRLLTLVPDIRADIVSWAATDDLVFLEIEFTGTLGGKPFSWRAVDKLTIDVDGQLLRRDAYFDSAPLVQTVLKRPRTWLRWWRSGIAPLDARRAFLRPKVTT